MARGDQIYVMREFFNLQGLYEHHGIDCGDGTVIHYRKPSETVERTSLATFAQGQKIYIRNYPVSYVSDVAVRRAENRLGERKYNLVFNNCEHFATWCKTGVNYSKQIKDFIPVLSHINVDNLEKPIEQALNEGNKDNTNELLNQALADIRVAWDNIQPQYKEAIKEIETWENVAKKALKENREDLARAAIQKKLNYKKRAEELEPMLKKLATMTETLIRNQIEQQKRKF
ncbi:MAG: lecithin retinol acyltransferase family protein [Oscillatoria sp. PMC 1051.18]|nr:lecithin retinol acyltransferase family protein [Oscillatoria sp. PMC 1050.18]MEC5032052.1 lecithin retinol acyltransferase family protein [Oscillatoria sp. PMC 1051.18]